MGFDLSGEPHKFVTNNRWIHNERKLSCAEAHGAGSGDSAATSRSPCDLGTLRSHSAATHVGRDSRGRWPPGARPAGSRSGRRHHRAHAALPENARVRALRMGSGTEPRTARGCYRSGPRHASRHLHRERAQGQSHRLEVLAGSMRASSQSFRPNWCGSSSRLVRLSPAIRARRMRGACTSSPAGIASIRTIFTDA